MELVFAVVGALSLIAGFALAFGGDALPLTPIGKVRAGDRVRVAGRIVSEKPLASPIKAEACVYWLLEVTARPIRAVDINVSLGDDDDGDSIDTRPGDTTVATREWADGLALRDDSGEVLLNPIGGRIDTTHGTRLTVGLDADERVREIMRRHAAHGVESESKSLEERVLGVDTNVVVEGVAEEIRGQLYLGGETRFSVEPGDGSARASAGSKMLGRGLLLVGVLCGVGFVIALMTDLP